MEQTGENGFPRKPTGILFCSYRNIRKSQGNLREFMGECNLGILYSSSLSAMMCFALALSAASSAETESSSRATRARPCDATTTPRRLGIAPSARADPNGVHEQWNSLTPVRETDKHPDVTNITKTLFMRATSPPPPPEQSFRTKYNRNRSWLRPPNPPAVAAFSGTSKPPVAKKEPGEPGAKDAADPRAVIGRILGVLC